MEPLVEGRRLGRFRLHQKLALGGVAEIWAAEDLQTTRQIALKVLMPWFARDAHFRARFIDEVGLSSQLRHPNIVEVYGAFEVDGRLCQAMERIDGCDLRRVLSRLARTRRRFPVGLALFTAREMARALAYAHERRGPDGRPTEVVHRDVSPHNVMLSRTGRVKMLDFGLASATERMARGQSGVVRGKIAYMAPEQALAVGVTPQTDIFATGVVLWEMLALQRLFVAADDPALVDRVVRAEVPSIAEFNADVPVEIAELVSAMLQQRAPNRPAAMRTVEQGLTRALAQLNESFTEERLADWLSGVLSHREPMAEDKFDHTEPTAVAGHGADDGGFGDATDPDGHPSPSGPFHTIEAPVAVVDHPHVPDPVARNGDPTLGHATPSSVGLDPVTPLTPTSADTSTDPFRLPTRSEILKAVENQPTQPVPAAASGPVAEAGEARGDAADADGAAELRDEPPEARAVEVVSAMEPWVSDHDEPALADAPLPAVVPPADRPAGHEPALGPVAEPVDLEAVERSRRGWLSSLTLILAVLVVILAFLLMARA